MTSRKARDLARALSLGLKVAVGVTLLLYPSGRFPFATRSPLQFWSGNHSPGAVEVPLEEVSRGFSTLSETELIRQVLRIIDQHYVQRDRLDPVRLLQAGFRALAQEVGVAEVEFVRNVEPFLHRDFERNVVRLCAWKSERRVSFCDASGVKGFEAQSMGRVKLAAREAPPSSVATALGALQSGDQNGLSTPFETPAVRVGERVFFANQAPSIGLRFVESLGRPAVSEVVRTTKVSAAKAMHAFLNGLLDELDPHSSYLAFDEYKELRSGTRGQFGGVGLVIDEVYELPLIREIVPNSPAHMAGIKPGDVLLRVGEKVVSFLSIDRVLKAVREVTTDAPTAVWLYRPSSGRIFRVFLTREEIPTRSVETKVVLGRPDILHVRVTGFSSHTADDILQAYDDAMRTTRGSLRAFVLDLRGNPGGLLDQAIQVADLFLRQGRIVSTRSRYDEQVESATKSQKIDLPVVVLMNSSSASASEIVAGALKDHNRGLVVGERSFGKGSVQSLFELGGGTALKLTIAHYFTPSGHSLQSVGVMPHVQVKLVQTRADSLWMSGASEPEREESLSAHLDNPDAGRPADIVASSGVQASDQSVLWAHTAPSFGHMEGLEELNFSYPSFENLDAVTDLRVDSVARVGISLLDRLLENSASGLGRSSAAGAAELLFSETSLFEVLPIVQRSEARILREAVQELGGHGVFFDPDALHSPAALPGAKRMERSFALAEPVRPRIRGFEKLFVRSGLGDHGVNTCCRHDSYAFRLEGSLETAPGEGSAGRFGYVGMRLEDNVDGGFVWVPASLKFEGKETWLGTFQVPPVFRAYLSEHGKSENGGVSFFFKRHISSPPLLLGVLPTEKSHSKNEAGESVVAKLDVFLRRTEGSLGEFVLQVKLAPRGLDASQRFDLMLVSLADRRLHVPKRVVSLRESTTGDYVAEIALSLKETSSLLQGQEFGGVIGGILRTEQGEVLGKWPLALLDEDSLREVLPQK